MDTDTIQINNGTTVTRDELIAFADAHPNFPNKYLALIDTRMADIRKCSYTITAEEFITARRWLQEERDRRNYAELPLWQATAR